MTAVMTWLLAKAPGFQQLSEDERDAITDFSVLWSLFEARVLGTRASAGRIGSEIESWREAGTLDAALYDDVLSYFRGR